MRPHRAQRLAQGAYLLALLLTEWHVPLLQRRQVRLRVLPPWQRFVPALCSCPRHQAVVGLGEVLVPTGPLGVIAGLLQGQGSRLALESLLGATLRQRLQGGVATRRVQRLHHGGVDGALHPQPAKRSARGGATIHPAPPTDIPGDPAGGATRGDRERATAPATTQQATEEGRAPFRSAPGPVRRPVALGCQALWGVQKVLPAQGPRVIVQQPHTPLRHRLVLAMALPRPPVDDHGLGGRAPRDQCPGIVRIAQQLLEAMRTGQAPADVPAQRPRADLRQWHLRITLPEPGLPGPTQLATLLEDAGAGVRHWAVRDLCDALVTRAHEPPGAFPQAMASLDGGCKGLAGALTHEAQRRVRPGALHPHPAALIALPRIIDALIVDKQGLRQRP
jgi:hypothetical protein